MDFIEYLEVIAKKLREAKNMNEYFRLTVLLRDTCNDTIEKLSNGEAIQEEKK